MSLTPALFTSARLDGADLSLLQPSHWNRVTSLLTSLLDGGVHGAVLYRDTADATDGTSWLTPVAAGSYLRSGGVATAPLWSTLTLPNAATLGDLFYASSANVMGSLADVAVGSVLVSGGVGAAPAWSATPQLSGVTWTKTNGSTRVLWQQHDPTITGTIGTTDGNVGGATFGMIYQPAAFTNGPGGQTNYVDDVWHIGMNLGLLSGGVGRADTSKPNFALSFESKFYAATNVFGQEFHLQGVSADGATTFRPLSFFMATDASVVNGTVATDIWNINNRSGASLLQVSNANAAVDLGTGMLLRFASNNVAIKQMNAAGDAFIDMIKIDAGDVTRFGAPVHASGNRAGASAPLPGRFAVFSVATANSGDTCVQAVAPSFTGNIYGFRATGAVAGVLENLVENTSTNAAANAKQTLQVQSGAAGDPYVHFIISGVQNWAIGCDNSDSDAFVISAASTLGASNALKLTTAGVMTVTGTLATTAGVAWNFGALTTGSSGQVVDATKFVTVTVAGTTVKLAVLA